MATTHSTLDSTWVLLATGSCIVQALGKQAAAIHIGSSAPAADSEDYHVLQDNSLSYGGTDSVYGRALGSSGAAIVVTAE